MWASALRCSNAADRSDASAAEMKSFGLPQIVLIALVAGALSCSTTQRPSTPANTVLIHYLEGPDGRPVRNQELRFAIFSKDGRARGGARSDAFGRVEYGMSLDSEPQELRGERRRRSRNKPQGSLK